MKRILTLFAAALAFVGCSHDEVVTPNVPTEKPTYYATFADAEGESRTYLDEHLKLLWHNDDRISLFQTTCNEEYAFADPTGSNSGAFNAVESDNWVTGNQTSTTYAVYPHNAANALSNSEVLTIHFADEQTYAEDSFGRGANTMVAATESATSKLLPFRNAGGYLMLKLYGENKTVKSIELKGNNDEVISGAATAEAKYGYLPSITMGATGGKTITLTCEEAVTLGATEEEATVFWLVVPPVTFEKGFTITVTDANGGTYTKSTSKSTTIERNTVKPMAALNPTFEGDAENPEIPEVTIPNNEIHYTATAQVTPYNTNAFGATYLADQSTYDSETQKGVLKFDGDVTQIGYNAFRGNKVLISLIIPNSVSSIANYAFTQSSITSIEIPNNVEIGESSFYDCVHLMTVKGEYASPDQHCWIVDGVLKIAALAKVSSYVMPSNITSIADYACMGFSALQNVSLPPQLSIIGTGAFYGCSSLKTIDLENTQVSTIKGSAFCRCSSLTEVRLPESLTAMPECYTFQYCSSLVRVYCLSEVPPTTRTDYIAWGAFDSNHTDRIIYVPQSDDDSIINSYKTARGWSTYADAIVEYDFSAEQ